MCSHLVRASRLVLLLVLLCARDATCLSDAARVRARRAGEAAHAAYVRQRERSLFPSRSTVQCAVGSSGCTATAVAASQPAARGVQVSLSEGDGLVFCRGCADPHVQGAFIETWEAAFHPHGFHVHGELVVAVPNDARSQLVNAVGGAVVLVDRGNVTFSDKARRCQEAGALAVVIADDGSCGEDFNCGARLGSRAAGGGLAADDGQRAWADVDVPVVLISARAAARLEAQLDLRVATVDGSSHRYVRD